MSKSKNEIKGRFLPLFLLRMLQKTAKASRCAVAVQEGFCVGKKNFTLHGTYFSDLEILYKVITSAISVKCLDNFNKCMFLLVPRTSVFECISLNCVSGFASVFNSKQRFLLNLFLFILFLF